MSATSKGNVTVMVRPKEHAPNGYATVSEAADRLGVTIQAIYNRIYARTIPFREKESLKPSGQSRYYIPMEWIEVKMEEKASRVQRVSEAKANLDDISERLNELSNRQDFVERLVVEALANPERQEQLNAERVEREAAVRERDELRMRVRQLVEPEQPLPHEPSDVASEPSTDDGVFDVEWAFDGKKLRRVRTRKSLSQLALAEKAGVSRYTINRLERRKDLRPHQPTLFGIAKALDVSPEDLMSPISENPS